MCVCALVLLGDGVSDLCVLNLVFCAGTGDVVHIVGLCIFLRVLCLAAVDFPPSELLVWIMFIIVGRVASLISFDVSCCWCWSTAPSKFLGRVLVL